MRSTCSDRKASGRTSLNAYGTPQHFRTTHKRGIEVFCSMLGRSDYTRRTLDHMIEVKSYLDNVAEIERKAIEREKVLAQKLKLAQCGILGVQ